MITDEQHRFGVSQRKLLNEKGESPDILIMTATPIPRTLAMVIYGDTDISIIDELPPGRKQIITTCVLRKAEKKVYDIVLGEVIKGRQAYIVAPLIEESVAVDAKVLDVEQLNPMGTQMFKENEKVRIHMNENSVYIVG